MKLLTIIAGLLIAGSAFAVDFQWDSYSGLANGLIFYWAETNSPPETFNKNLPVTDTLYTVQENHLKPNVSYDFWLTAYNADGESSKSNIVNYTRDATYIPPDDNLPVVIYAAPGVTITITITQ